MGNEGRIERTLMADELGSEIGISGAMVRSLYKDSKIPGEPRGKKRVFFNAAEVLAAIRLQGIKIRGWTPPEETTQELSEFDLKVEAIESRALKRAQETMIEEVTSALEQAKLDAKVDGDYRLVVALHRKIADMLEEASTVVQSDHDGQTG